MFFIPAVCSPCLARGCSLFSVNMVTAAGPNKPAFQVCCRSQGSSGHLGHVPGDSVLLSVAHAVTQLLPYLDFGDLSTFTRETEPGVWRGRGHPPNASLESRTLLSVWAGHSSRVLHVFPALFSFHLHHRHRTKHHEELEEVTGQSIQNHQALSFMAPHYPESCKCQTLSFPILAWLLS